MKLHYLKAVKKKRCIWFNGMKILRIIKDLIALQIEKLFTVTITFVFYTTFWCKFRCRTPLFHRRNGWCRSVGSRKTIPGSWLLKVVDTAERIINVAFIHSFNYRKVACAVRNRYAEQFCPQMWSHDSRK